MKKRLALALPFVCLLAACGKNAPTNSSPDDGTLAGAKVYGHWVDSAVTSSSQRSKPLLGDDDCLNERKERQILNPVLSVDWKGNVSFYPDDKSHRKFAGLKGGRLYLVSQSNPDFPKGWTVGDGATVHLKGDSMAIEWQGEDIETHQTKDMSLRLTRAKGGFENKFYRKQYDCVTGHVPGRLNGQDLGEGLFTAMGKRYHRKAVFTQKSGAPVVCQYSADKQSLIVSAKPASVEQAEIDSSSLVNADSVPSDPAGSSTSTSTSTGTSTNTGTGTAPPSPANPAQPQSFKLTIPAATALDGATIPLTFGKSSAGLELVIAASKEDSFKGDGCQLKIKKSADVLDGVISCRQMEYFPGGIDGKQAVDIQGEFGCDMPTAP